MGGFVLEVVVGGTDGSPYPVRAEWGAARILAETGRHQYFMRFLCGECVRLHVHDMHMCCNM